MPFSLQFSPTLCIFFFLPSSFTSIALSSLTQQKLIPFKNRTIEEEQQQQQQQQHISDIIMAVEARHLNLFPSQLITNRQVMDSGEANMMNMYNNSTPIGGYSSFLPLSGAVTETALPSSVFNHSLANAVKSESGVTYNNNNNNNVSVSPMSRKRSRDNNNNYGYNNNNNNDSFSFLGQDVSLQIQQQQLDIEHLIMQRMEKVRMEIDEKRKRQARRIIEAIEVGVMKKLKTKEEEIEKIGKLNWALEEKVKHLCMENQVWRNIAETNEATANALRCNLEQVLAQRGGMAAEEDVGGGATVCGGAEMDDAESCCGSTEEDGLEKETGGWRTLAGCAGVKDKEGGGNGRLCRNCRKEESCVLILPCRHLCLCTVCGSSLHICPICKSYKTASVHVNMS